MYFLENRETFHGENGHMRLVNSLKKIVEPINDDNILVLGIDVGACIGDYINNISEICMENNKNILCFEPNPLNNKQLELKINNINLINNNNNIKLFKHCLSNENTISSFHNYINNNNTVGNQLGGLRSGGSKICDIEIKTLSNVLDNEFSNDNIVIKFIKIDTEGNDTNVIKGMQKYLHKTKYIIFESSDTLDDNRGPDITNPMKDIVDFLSENNFDTYKIGTKKLLKINDQHWHQIYEDVKFWSNSFALKKDDTIINKLIDETFDYII